MSVNVSITKSPLTFAIHLRDIRWVGFGRVTFEVYVTADTVSSLLFPNPAVSSVLLLQFLKRKTKANWTHKKVQST